MNAEKAHSVYLIGIGGIGMSGLARYFNTQGWYVCGYDKTPSPLTEKLRGEGIYIHFDEQVDAIPERIRQNEEALIIRTPAVPDSSPLVTHWANGRIRKRAEVLGQIAAEHQTLAVAGTHGKTTVSSMLAHILEHSSMPINAFLGGIANNFQSNVVLSEQAEICVVEADEFDRSFLHLHPEHAVITSVDADHLDIYGSSRGIFDGYQAFAGQVKDNLILHHKAAKSLGLKTLTYGLEHTADIHARDVLVRDGQYSYDIITPSGVIEDVRLGMAGRHNVENSLAAVSLAELAGVSHDKIKSALASFLGIERRFNVLINTNNGVLVDDYAHHPTELTAAIISAREMFPGRNLTVAFQPHLFSRTKDFATGFASSLSLADQLVLLDIYPAREQPIKGVTSEWLATMIDVDPCIVCSRSELKGRIADLHPDVLLVLGAGDIGLEVNGLKEQMEAQIA